MAGTISDIETLASRMRLMVEQIDHLGYAISNMNDPKSNDSLVGIQTYIRKGPAEGTYLLGGGFVRRIESELGKVVRDHLSVEFEKIRFEIKAELQECYEKIKDISND